MVLFVLVLSMTFTAPHVLAGGVIFTPGDTTIEVGQGQEFTLRFKLYWDEPAYLGYFSFGFYWDSPRTDSTGTPSENFTFVSASAYLEDNLDTISTNVTFSEGVSPENSNMWGHSIVVSHQAGYPWDGNFYVDIVLRASGYGGVSHIAPDNHTILIISTIDVAESTIESYSPPNPYITVRVGEETPAAPSPTAWPAALAVLIVAIILVGGYALYSIKTGQRKRKRKRKVKRVLRV